MSMNKCWSLFNKEDKLRIDDLAIEQVRTILLAISAVRMKDWYACREGDVTWQLLQDIPEFYEDVAAAVSESPNMPHPPAKETPSAAKPAPVRRPLFEEMHGTESTLQVESVQTKERRSARRYARRLQFRVPVSGGIFECLTNDISMSGLSLSKPLPASVGKSFRAELSMNGQKMTIKCQQVTDHQMKILEAEAWDVLRLWITNW